MARRSRVFWLVGAAAAIALIVFAFFIVRGMAPESAPPPEPPITQETPTPTPSPVAVETPASEAAPEGLVPGGDGAGIVMAPVAGLAQALADPSTPVDLSGVADGLALSDFNSEVTEFVRDGLHQVGSPAVASATVVSSDLAATPAVAVVNVCLDRSEVRVLDADGKDMSDPAAPQRVQSLWTMTMTDSGWKIIDRTFTDELTC